MYTALYSLNQVVSRRTDWKATSQSLRSIFQSSFFLGFNAYAVILIFCLSRRLMGKFYYVLAAHIPAIIGSYLAIQLERPARRSALSFYVANVAGETVFHKILHKGWFPRIPSGEVLLFAASTAGLLAYIQANGFAKDPVSLGLKFLLGTEFAESATTAAGDKSHIVRHNTWSERVNQAEKQNLTPGHKGKNDYDDDDEDDRIEGARQRHAPLAVSQEGEYGDDYYEAREERAGENQQHKQQQEEGGMSQQKEERISGAGISGHHHEEEIRREEAMRRRSNDRKAGDESIRCALFACPHDSRSARQSLLTSLSHRPSPSSSSSSAGVVVVVPLSGYGLLWSAYQAVRRFVTRSSIQTASCSAYALHAFARNFVLSFTGHWLLNLLMRPKALVTKPLLPLIRESLVGPSGRRSLRLGLFVASFAALFKSSSCAMRAVARTVCGQNPSSQDERKAQSVEKVITFTSGLIAGSSMLWSPSSTAAQYVMWKLIETLYFDAVRRGKISGVGITMDLLYAVSTAQLFYVAVMEPKMMRRSYTKWLNRVTRNSFGLMNRSVIDVFGTEASFGYQPLPDLQLDVNHCSEKFKESVLVWMI